MVKNTKKTRNIKKKTVKKSASNRKIEKKPAKEVVKKNAKPSKKPVKKRVMMSPQKVTDMQIISVFGNRVKPSRIKTATRDAYQRGECTTEDIRLSNYIKNPTDHNLMVKISILDRIEEMAAQMYPQSEIIRKNKITLIID